MTKRYQNILETIGNTPVVRLASIMPERVQLYAKIEAFNPMGSVKDRLAIGIIEDAERSGALRPGQTVIEATSGNTGIGLAMVCARKGYPLVVTMAENFSVERRKLLRFLGAKVVLTPAAEKGSGMLRKARELAEAHGWFLCRQFENEANANIHSRTTAVEILDDFADAGLDYWVTGYGTGGTLKGVARVLKERSPQTRIVVCEPDNSQVLGSGIAQERNVDGSPAASHPMFRPHLMQGWSPDFVPKLTEDAVAMQLVDQIVPISGASALHGSRELAQREGILVGISAGATLAGALKISETAPDGATVLCMLPDTGERYLTTTLFENIRDSMNDEELEISRSTPSCRFDAPTPAPTTAPASVAPAAAATADARSSAPAASASPAPASASASTPAAAHRAPVRINDEATDFIEQVISAPEQPVVIFALEWCEFCWSVRKMFAHYHIPYRSIDLDSVEYQADDRGGKIRAALTAKTGVKTIPQIFIGGQFVGGCTDVFDSFRAGRLQQQLAAAAVSLHAENDMDPYGFLPGWLHPR